MTDGAEENGVVLAQDVPAVGRHHPAGFQIVIAAPGQAIPFQNGAGLVAQGGVGDADGLVDYFGADAVAADDRDAKSCHCKILVLWL